MSEGQWAADPFGRYDLRYFDGTRWTGHVSVNGEVTFDEPSASGSTSRRNPAIWWSSRRGTASYLGSHPSRSATVEHLTIGMIEDGFFAMDLDEEPVLAIAWDDVREVVVESTEQIQSRVTATRVLLLGAFAWLAKKHTSNAFFTLRDDGGEWVFAVADSSAVQMWSDLLPVKARRPRLFGDGIGHGPSSPSAPAVVNTGVLEAPAALTVKDRLDRLSTLHAEGVLTDDEHAARRAAIIAEL